VTVDSEIRPAFNVCKAVQVYEFPTALEIDVAFAASVAFVAFVAFTAFVAFVALTAVATLKFDGLYT
jgi:hypothetical protein